MSRIDLVLPGLIPPADFAPARPVPLLATLLARADPLPPTCADVDSLLLTLFRHPEPASGAIAPYTRLLDLPGVTGDDWMRADPVSLRADLTDVLLFDSDSFALNGDEADRLLADLNAFFHEEPWELLRGTAPGRWYLCLHEPPAIETTPLARVHGHAIARALPRGASASYWCRIGNEIQMLLYQHPLNQSREEQGLPPVNGLWFWGNGSLRSLPADYRQVYADDPLSHGLACHAGVEMAAPKDFSALVLPERGESVLLVSLQLQQALAALDLHGWQSALETLMTTGLETVMQAWKRGHLDAVNLYTESGCFHNTRTTRWRLWRREWPISSYGLR